MPTVPTYSIPQVAPGSQPMAAFDAPSLPDVAGRQLQELGKATLGSGLTAIKTADRLQAEIDDATTKELDNQLADSMRVALYDKDAGYLNKLGKAAVTGRGDTIKALKELHRSVGQGATTDIQRTMFNQVAGRRMQAALMKVDSHAAQQTRVWKEGETVARIESTVADAVANSAGWKEAGGTFAVARATALAEAGELAELRGYDVTQREQLMAKTLAGLHGTVLTNMVSLGQSKSAREYLEQAAPELVKGAPDKLDALRNLVKQAGIKDESLTLSMQMSGDPRAATRRLDEMFTRGEISADVRDATVQRVEHNWSVAKAQQAEGEKALLGNAIDWVIKNPGKDIQDIPSYAALKSSGHLDNVYSFWKSSGKPATDAETYYSFRRMAMDDPAAFAGLDLNTVRAKVSSSDFERLIDIQASISKADAKTLQLGRVMKSTLSMISGELKAIGLDTTPKEGSPQAKDFALFQGALLRALDDASQNGPLNDKDARQIGLGLLREGIEQGSGIGGFFQTKRRAYQFRSDPDNAANYVAARYQDIPIEIRNKLVEAYQAKTGEKFTPGIYGALPRDAQKEIERAYTRGIERGSF